MRHLIHIRPFQSRDLDDAARAANAACWQAYAFFGYAHPVSTTRRGLEEAMAEGQQLWTPEIGGVIAGILTLRPNFIDKLFLAPVWQGFGLGSALITRAKMLFPGFLELHCAQQNFPACRFYERRGFVAMTYRFHAPSGVAEIVYRWPGKYVHAP